MSSSPPLPSSLAPVRVRLAGLGAPALFAVLAAALASLGGLMLQDPDTHWHVAIGTAIRQDGAVPWVDRWSHTFAGAPWIAKEWLAQVLLSGLAELGGAPALVAGVAVVVAGSFAGLFAWLVQRLPGSTALIAVLVALILSLEHVIVRPHVLTLPLLLLWTGLLLRAAERGEAPSLALVPLMALWANLHAGWPVMFAVAAALGAEAVLAAPPHRRARVLARGAAVGAATALAAFATPYGLAPLRIGANLLGGGEPLAFITEWQPLRPDLFGALAAALAVGAVALLSADGRRGLPRLLLVLLLAALAARYSRFLTLFALVTVMVSAAPLARRLGRTGSSAATLRPLALALLMAGALAAAGIASASSPRPAASVTPSAALAAAGRAGLTGPVYNSYDFGGYLIARGVPTFIDGRTDQLFLGGFMNGLYTALLAGDRTAFQALLDRHGVTWALVRAGTPEAPLLRDLGWREIHRDTTALVFVRP